MKRTKLKKKSGLRRKSKLPISKLQRQIWELCKQITRKKYGNTCYTCGRSGLTGSNWHTSHLWPKAALGAYLKYDLRVLRPACYHCNINLGGNGAVYYAKMLREIGFSQMKELERDKLVLVRAYEHYVKVLDEYQKICTDLSTS
jgi:hypothetical protein